MFWGIRDHVWSFGVGYVFWASYQEGVYASVVQVLLKGCLLQTRSEFTELAESHLFTLRKLTSDSRRL